MRNRTRRHRFRCFLGVAAVALAIAPAQSLAAPPDQTVVLMVYRTTTQPGSLELSVSAPPGSGRSAVATAYLDVEGPDITNVIDGSAVAFGAADDARVTAGGESVRLCDHGACAADAETWTAGFGLSMTNPEGMDGVNVVLVAARGPRISYSYRLKGWAIRRVSTQVRWVPGGDAALVGAYGSGSGVETFEQTTAPGGRYGSVAVAVAPCSQASTSVSRGAGLLTLEGGWTRPSVGCPTAENTMASWASSATTWRVTGTAAGDTTLSDARLFVIDLPKALPTPMTWPWR